MEIRARDTKGSSVSSTQQIFIYSAPKVQEAGNAEATDKPWVELFLKVECVSCACEFKARERRGCKDMTSLRV